MDRLRALVSPWNTAPFLFRTGTAKPTVALLLHPRTYRDWLPENGRLYSVSCQFSRL